MIKAEDSGKLSSSATINIKVTDINDKNPEFQGDPYRFTVKEGLNKTLVGVVHADDADEGVNAVVRYFIPTNLPFDIDNESGEIVTNKPLDYEKQKVGTSLCVKLVICNHVSINISWPVIQLVVLLILLIPISLFYQSLNVSFPLWIP